MTALGVPRFLEQDVFQYFMNWKAVGGAPWSRAFAAPFAVMQAMDDLSVPRRDPPAYLAAHQLSEAARIIRGAGWHFSWMGGLENMLNKLRSFAHTEQEVQKWLDPHALARAVRRREFFYNGTSLRQVPVDSSFPALIQKQKLRYEADGLLAPKPGLRDFVRGLYPW